MQIVYRQRQLPFAEEDLSQAANRDAALLALAAAERERGFELQRAPLLRLLLVKTAEGEHHLIYTHHHILLDGWSNAQLLSEVLESMPDARRSSSGMAAIATTSPGCSGRTRQLPRHSGASRWRLWTSRRDWSRHWLSRD